MLNNFVRNYFREFRDFLYKKIGFFDLSNIKVCYVIDEM